MTAAPITGIEPVDRELRRRKFTDAETAEATANKLLAIWRALQVGSNDAYVALAQARHRRRHGRR
jgi:hypothetical protein